MLTAGIEPGCLNCVYARDNYKNLSAEELIEINSNRTEIVFKKGELICKQGSYVSGIVFVKSGLVKVFVEHGNDSTFLLFKVTGTYLGLSSLFNDSVHHYSAEALSQTEVCLINFDAFGSVVKNNNKFAVDIIKLLNQEKSNSYRRLMSLAHKQLHGRIAELILYLSDEVYKSNPFLITISKTELANLVASSKESVSRVFAEFKRSGLLTEDNHLLHIKDAERMRRISEMG